MDFLEKDSRRFDMAKWILPVKEKLYKLDESDYIKGYYRSKPAQNINNKERKKEIDKMLNNIMVAFYLIKYF